MTDNSGIRSGSLQFYPRGRAKKILPSVNWKPISKEGIGLLGFIGYKAGMMSVLVRDDTPDSMTKGKKIAVPATLIECPPMKIYSIRFYNNGKVSKEIVVSNEKELKRKIKVSKKLEKNDDEISDFDDVRAILYSNVKKTGIGKKKPDFIEIGLSGSKKEKLNFLREKIGKEISVEGVFSEELVDIRGVSRGFGTQGPVKRFGISLKSHKSEKGRRRPGSLGPWHPARVTFRAPQAGQKGYQNRICYNSKILNVGKISKKDINKKGGFEHFGFIKTDYIILSGSIPGPKKRGVIITHSIKPTKNQLKKKFEMLKIV